MSKKKRRAETRYTLKSQRQLRRLGAAVQAAREAAQMSQTELAQRAGIDNARVSDLEHGRMNPSYLWLRALADALGVDISELLKTGQ